MRFAEGGESEVARGYQVVLRSTTAELEVVFGVMADNEAEAVSLAEDFHGRAGFEAYGLSDVQAISAPGQDTTGVYWRMERPVS